MRIRSTNSNFIREPLKAPFGFKGGYLNELWQTVAKISTADHTGIGVGVQSVLWSDSGVFTNVSQSCGNAYMYAMSDYALKRMEGAEFEDPFTLLEELFPEVYEYGKRITNNSKLRKTFALNSLVCVDNAAWQLYAKENQQTDFLKLIPGQWKSPLENRHDKLCNVPLVSYNMSVADVKKLIDEGFFFLKIKIGSDPEKDGSMEKMLEWDKKRLREIHEAVKDVRTPYTESGHIPYYLDANGRYDSKQRLSAFLEYADKIGALDRIMILEEPFPEEYKEDISDLNVRIAADESAHSYEDVIERIELGYTAIALKPIAKTMSMSVKILNEAYRRKIPCFCADLTVNPWMVDFNKNIAARIDLLPGMKIGVLESNGAQNYANWEKMKTYHPLFGSAPYIEAKKGIFELGEAFFETSGGIFCDSPYYEQFV